MAEGEYVISEALPSTDVYLHLRAACGLGPRTVEAARQGLRGTWFGVLAQYDGYPVGMGRVIGDGGCFFQLVDICVIPQQRGHGLGQRIVDSLVNHLNQHAPESAYVSLIASPGAIQLYQRSGFTETAPQVGMSLKI